MQCISVVCTETSRTVGERAIISDKEGLAADKLVRSLGTKFSIYHKEAFRIQNLLASKFLILFRICDSCRGRVYEDFTNIRKWVQRNNRSGRHY